MRRRATMTKKKKCQAEEMTTKKNNEPNTASRLDTGTGYKRAVLSCAKKTSREASNPATITSTQQGSHSADTGTLSYSAQRELPYEASFELNVPSESDSSKDGSDEDNLIEDEDEVVSSEDKFPISADYTVSDDERAQSTQDPILNITEKQESADPQEVGTGDSTASPLVVDPLPMPTSKKRSVNAPAETSGVKKKKVDVLPVSRREPITSDDAMTLVRQEMSSLHERLDKLNAQIVAHVDSRLWEVQRSFSDNINELRLLINHNVTDGKRKKESTSKPDLEVPFFNIVFSDATMQVVIEKCMVGHLISTTKEYISLFGGTHKDWRSYLARGAGLALRIMLFAVNLKKKEGKALYDTKVGVKFSEFREGIVLSALMAAKRNSFNLFRTGHNNLAGSVEGVDGIGGSSGMDMSSKKPKLPVWLQGDFIGPAHIASARMKMEETKSKSENKQPAVEGRVQEVHNEIASSAASQLYRIFTQKLTSSRMTAKCSFFEEVGYLFIDWNTICNGTNQGSIKFGWASSAPSLQYDGIDSVPETMPRFMASKDGESDETQFSAVNKHNKSLLTSLMNESQDMILRVEHEVFIRRQTKKNVRSIVKEESQTDSGQNSQDISESQTDSVNSEVKEDMDYERKELIYRDINLIDISSRVLCCYSSQIQHRSPASFLCSSKDSLRCVYAVAVLFKKLIEKAISVFDGDKVDEELVLTKTQVNGMNLRAMLPTPARQCRAIVTKAVYMFPNLYTARCNRVRPEVVNLTSPGGTIVHENPRAGGRDSRNTRIVDIA